MRFLKWYAVLLVIIMIQTVAGCGGGGGGAVTLPTTKTATLKLSTQSATAGVSISGFDLTLNLPSVSTLPIGASGNPLPSAVFLTGEFSEATPIDPDGISYNTALHEITLIYGSSNSYSLGEFLTISLTVPSNYVLNQSDIDITLFEAHAPNSNPIDGVTAKVESFYEN